jgi:hypothetical protein
MYQLILDYYQGEKSHSWLALGLGGLFLITALSFILFISK